MRKIITLLITGLIISACSVKEPVVMPGDVSYKKGMELMQEEEFKEAAEMFENTIREGDNPELVAKAQIMLGDAYFMREDYIKAIPAYEMYIQVYPDTPSESKAIYKLALSYYNQLSSIDRNLDKIENALKYFTTLKNKYPNYEGEVNVSEKIKEVKDMLAERELYVLEFYLRTNQPQCAAARADYLVMNYGNSEFSKGAYFQVAEYYFEKENYEEAENYLKKYLKEQPNGEHKQDAGEMLLEIENNKNK